MSKSYNIDTLDPLRFMARMEERQKRIAEAPAKEITSDYEVNKLADALHPQKQFVRIQEVIERDADCKSFVLTADLEKGTKSLAYFSAGQYLTVFLDIEGMKLTRAYSISSSPKEALEGKYMLTVKSVQDGLASRYILDNWKEGDSVEVSAPEGFFEYNSLRDAKTVIGVAGGSGITPFLSMAQAIRDGDEDFNLILLYGSREADHILFKEAFDRIMAETDKVKVIHVLSHEEREGFEHGFVTADLIRKYAPDTPYSVFLCGPQQMYAFVDKELEKLSLERKYIRHELFGEMHNPKAQADYPGCASDTIRITVTVRDETRTVTGSANDSVLQILEKNGIRVPSRCRSGECGWCHSRLISGKVYIPKEIDGRRMADLKYGYIHPCATFGLSDLEIEVPAAK